MFKRLVRNTSLNPVELELLSGAFQRLASVLTLPGYRAREDLAFDVLGIYARGVRDEDEIVERLLRSHATQIKAA